MSIFGSHKTRMVAPEAALPGRPTPMAVPDQHEVLGTPLRPPYPPGMQVAEACCSSIIRCAPRLSI